MVKTEEEIFHHKIKYKRESTSVIRFAHVVINYWTKDKNYLQYEVL